MSKKLRPKIVYVGPDISYSIRQHSRIFEIPATDMEKLGFCSLIPTLKPEAIPDSAVREGDYFVQRKRFVCLMESNEIFWFTHKEEILNLIAYHFAILDRPCLTTKELEHLMKIKPKFLNNKAREMRSILEWDKYLRETIKASKLHFLYR